MRIQDIYLLIISRKLHKSILYHLSFNWSNTLDLLDYNYSFIAALIIILREVLISGLRESMSSYKISLEVSILSKWKTAIQLLCCGSFLVWRSDILLYEIKLLGLISYTVLWFAAIITAITGIEYILKVNLFFKDQKK